MNPFSAIRRFFSASHPSNPDAGLVQVLGGQPTATGIAVTPDNAETVVAIFAAVRIIAETVAVLPCHLMRRIEPRGKERAREHPLYRLLHDRPNDWQTPFEFKEMMTGHLALRGMAYAQKVMLANGTVEQLIPLHPDRVRPRVDPHFGIVWDYTPTTGGTRTFARHELFRLIANTVDGITGRSPVQVLADAVGGMLATDQFTGKFFANSASPGGVLIHPRTLSTEAKKKLKEEWDARHGGPGATGRTAVLEEGLTWTQVGMKLSDAQLLELRKFQVTDAARMYRIPPHKLQEMTQATFSNIEHQSIEFVVDTAVTWLTRWEEGLRRDLLEDEPDAKDLYFKFLVEALLRGDQKSRYEAYAIGRSWGWLSADDVREFEDMNPLPDGQGEEYLRPANMLPAGTPLIDGKPAKSYTTPLPTPAPAGAAAAEFAALLRDPLHRIARRESQRIRDTAKKHGAGALPEVYDGMAAEVARTIEPVAIPATRLLAVSAGVVPDEGLADRVRGVVAQVAAAYVRDAQEFWREQAAAGAPNLEHTLAEREAALPAALTAVLVQQCLPLVHPPTALVAA